MPYIPGDLPKYMQPQPFEKSEDTRKKAAAKLQNAREKKYATKGDVHSLTLYLYVPKGETDIHIVYDTMKSGLNQSLWVPNFGLFTVDVLVHNVSEQSWMADLQPYCRVDLRPYFQDECLGTQTLWERWVRCMMGLNFPPCVCIKDC
jgi:hypothetical protein